MRRIDVLVLLTALIFSAVPAASAAAGTLVIRGATVIDGTGAEPRVSMAVIVRDGVIAAVVPDADLQIPSEAQVIDGRGKYLIPGLADMHVHFGHGGRDVPGDDALRVSPHILEQFLFYGVTNVLSVGGSGGSTDAIQRIRHRVSEEDLVSPRLHATGGLLTLPGSHPVGTLWKVPPGADPATYDWTPRGATVVPDADAAKAAVRSHARDGMDAIKIVVESGPDPFGDDHPQMPLPMIRAIVEEAAQHGLPVVAHASSLDELEEAVAGGVRAVVHSVHPFPQKSHWSAMRDRDVFLVPTMSAFAPMISDRWSRPGALNDGFLRSGVEASVIESLLGYQSPARELPAAARSSMWAAGLRSIGEAHAAGVPIALGTDTNMPFVFPGHSVHVELELLVEAGLTPMEAIIAATRRPAELLRKDRQLGTIEPGKRADLVLLRGNPLDDIRNTRTIDEVVMAGERVDREALSAASRAARRAETARAAIHAVWDMWSSGEVPAAGSVFAETFVYEDPAAGIRMGSLEEMRELVQVFDEAVRDLTTEIENLIVVGRHAFAEWTMSGIQVGSLGETLPGTGKRFEFPGVSAFVLTEEGKIARATDYYDSATWSRQVREE